MFQDLLDDYRKLEEELKGKEMSKYSRLGKVAKTGAVDSKYFRNADKFEDDINSKLDDTRKFKDSLKQMILENPDLIEQRYFNAIEVLKEIKEDIGI